MTTTPPICSYEGSDYQQSFWDQGGRRYEDGAEAVALRRLLPPGGDLLLELGAGAGRNTPRYTGFKRIVLLDYSRTQLEQARARLGDCSADGSTQYTFVAADVYRLPFVDGLFDAATMIRTLHHMADARQALSSVRRTLRSGAIFVLEYANKRNLKAILRYAMGSQKWNPFSPEPVEFAALNFDFHPATVRAWLTQLGFAPERVLTVSHFRMGLLKKLLPTSLLVWMDSLAQPTGSLWQLTPSVFIRSRVNGQSQPPLNGQVRFCCPACQTALEAPHEPAEFACAQCGAQFSFHDGIHDFRINPEM